jgi:hypothetical protein
MMKRFDIGLSFAVCFAAMIWGAVAHADVLMLGIGNKSCGQFIAASGKRPPGIVRSIRTPDGDLLESENAEYLQWLLAFVSGFNSAERGQQVRVDPAGMDLWMRKWCNQHPVKTVFEGAEAFIVEMLTNAAAQR